MPPYSSALTLSLSFSHKFFLCVSTSESCVKTGRSQPNTASSNQQPASSAVHKPKHTQPQHTQPLPIQNHLIRWHSTSVCCRHSLCLERARSKRLCITPEQNKILSVYATFRRVKRVEVCLSCFLSFVDKVFRNWFRRGTHLICVAPFASGNFQVFACVCVCLSVFNGTCEKEKLTPLINTFLLLLVNKHSEQNQTALCILARLSPADVWYYFCKEQISAINIHFAYVYFCVRHSLIFRGRTRLPVISCLRVCVVCADFVSHIVSVSN